jgi:hypothetical protein
MKIVQLKRRVEEVILATQVNNIYRNGEQRITTVALSDGKKANYRVEITPEDLIEILGKTPALKALEVAFQGDHAMMIKWFEKLEEIVKL